MLILDSILHWALSFAFAHCMQCCHRADFPASVSPSVKEDNDAVLFSQNLKVKSDQKCSTACLQWSKRQRKFQTSPLGQVTGILARPAFPVAWHYGKLRPNSFQLVLAPFWENRGVPLPEITGVHGLLCTHLHMNCVSSNSYPPLVL